MKFCDMNDILCDKWKKKLGYLHNLNTNQTKTHKQTSFTLVLKHEKEI